MGINRMKSSAPGVRGIQGNEYWILLNSLTDSESSENVRRFRSDLLIVVSVIGE